MHVSTRPVDTHLNRVEVKDGLQQLRIVFDRIDHFECELADLERADFRNVKLRIKSSSREVLGSLRALASLLPAAAAAAAPLRALRFEKAKRTVAAHHARPTVAGTAVQSRSAGAYGPLNLWHGAGGLLPLGSPSPRRSCTARS